MQSCWWLLVSSLMVVSIQRSTVRNMSKKYHLIDGTPETWYRSLHYCHSRGMRFASVMTKDDSDKLLEEIRDTQTRSDVWIGGTCSGNEPYFYWIDRNKAFLIITDWMNGEPDNLNGKEDCLAVRYESDLKFKDSPCDEKKYFVCEDSGGLPGDGPVLETHESF